MRAAIASVAALSTASVAMAQGTSSPVAELAPGIVQTALGLALVLALIFAVGWLMRRASPAAGAGSLLRTVASLPVGQRERAVLVEVGDQWLLLGVAAGAVSMLHAFPKGCVPEPVKPMKFAQLLAAARAGRAR